MTNCTGVMSGAPGRVALFFAWVLLTGMEVEVLEVNKGVTKSKRRVEIRIKRGGEWRKNGCCQVIFIPWESETLSMSAVVVGSVGPRPSKFL